MDGEYELTNSSVRVLRGKLHSCDGLGGLVGRWFCS